MSLAEIRAKLQAQANRGQNNNQQSSSDKVIFPHWNIQEGESASIRFLPDADKTNSFFWIERAMIKLPFRGVVGQMDDKEHIVQVPCMEMYGENCPILSEVRTWYKDDTLKEVANKYWKKRSYIFQGFVRVNPLTEDSAPENPIRRFVITNQIFNVIKASLMDPEIEELPTDYVRGLDFKIVKTSKGGYADYSTSGWARKESALTEAERAAIDLHGLFTLREFLPKKPSESELRVIREMFEASVDGRPYDPKWASYYKPWGLDLGNAGSAPAADPEVTESVSAPRASAQTATKLSTAESNTAPWEDEEPVATSKIEVKPQSGDKAQDILALIRSRQNKAA